MCGNRRSQGIYNQGIAINLFHNNFSSSCEKPENCKLAHELQPNANCIATFHKYYCYAERVGDATNLTLQNHWVYVTYVSKYHNAGIWGMDWNLLRFMSKNIQ